MVALEPVAAAQRASFATTARLFSCLVTEGLIHALYIPLETPEDAPDITGACIAFDGSTSESRLLAVIPLRHIPVFKHGAAPDARGREIGLLDPMDMKSFVYHVYETKVVNGNTDPEDPVRPYHYYACHGSPCSLIKPLPSLNSASSIRT